MKVPGRLHPYLRRLVPSAIPVFDALPDHFSSSFRMADKPLVKTSSSGDIPGSGY